MTLKIIIFAITFGIALVMLNNSAFALPEYCQQIDGQVNCEISILPYPNPKQDYLPGVAEIPKGATIIFKNDGFNVHTATSTSASPEENSYLAVKRIDGVFDTGKLLAGEMSKPFTISEKGEYHYLCMIHDAMRGTIILTDAATPAETFSEEPIIQPGPGQDPRPIQIPEPEPIPAPPFPGPSEEEDPIEENKRLKEENADLKEENAELKAVNRELEDKKSILETEIDELKKRVDDLMAVVMEQIKVIMETLKNLKLGS